VTGLPPNWPTLRLFLVGSLIPGSTEVVDVVDAAAGAQVARAAAGRGTAQRRQEEMRDRIVAAAGAAGLIPTHPGWVQAVQRRIEKNPPRYGFEQAPDVRTIRKAQAHLQKFSTSVPSCTPLQPIALQTASTSTT
jgi:hypothetical protein